MEAAEGLREGDDEEDAHKGALPDADEAEAEGGAGVLGALAADRRVLPRL